MKITDVAIDRRTTVFVLLVLIVGMGIFSYISLPREAMPSIESAYVIVTAMYFGVSPEDMESLITIPLERHLTGISGIKTITSNSGESASMIMIEFEADEPMAEATQKVRDRVAMARADLPLDAEDPIVREGSMSDYPVVFINLTGTVAPATLSKLAEDLEDQIESLPSVLEVNVSGGVEREIQIEVDPVRVEQYGVSLSDLIQLTLVENVNIPAGAMNVGEAKYLMRVPGELKSPDELRDLVVKQGETGVVYLRDLAEIRDGFKEKTSYSRLNGKPSVTLTVTKRSGENIIKVAEQVRALVAQANEVLPQGVSLHITADMSKDIANTVQTLENSILTGLVLVVGILFLFLGVSNALFVAMAVPISLMITFIVMDQVGGSLNSVSLFSLMVALGMLVDNGIVVVENIHRHAQMGKDRITAAKEGTAEVAWPIFASTVTTVAAFFPMLFWPGMWGKFMNILPKTVSIALLASLFVGLIVNPSLASVFGTSRKSERSGQDPRVRRRWVIDTYGSVLRLALRWRAVTITLTLTALAGIIVTYFAGFRYEFLATLEPERANVNIQGPEGSSLDSTDAIVRQVEAIMQPEAPNLEYLIASVGTRGYSGRYSMRGGSAGQTSHLASVTLDFPDIQDASVPPSEIIQRIRHAFDEIVGADVRISESNNMSMSAGPPVNIELSGEDFGVLAELTREIEARIKDIPGLVDLDNDLDRGKPEVKVIVDRQKAKLASLNTQFIGSTVQAAINGRIAGEYRVGDDEYDVVVRFPQAFREDLSNIESMNLINLLGQPIPFSSVARLEHGAGLGSIRRVDRKRMVTISAGAQNRLGSEVLYDVRMALADMPKPLGYAISYTGENEDTMETMRFLLGAFVTAFFLIALVLITQFNSVVQSMVIMSSVILSLAGVFFGLLIFDMTFSVLMTGIGCVSLAGIVVNNAIVLVDFINKLREQGKPLEEAIVLAGQTRFRPVLLTAVTTILGLIPMAIGITFDFRNLHWVIGTGHTQGWGSMAIAIIFGLTFATVLTLVLVPVFYSFSVRDSSRRLADKTA